MVVGDIDENQVDGGGAGNCSVEDTVESEYSGTASIRHEEEWEQSGSSIKHEEESEQAAAAFALEAIEDSEKKRFCFFLSTAINS